MKIIIEYILKENMSRDVIPNIIISSKNILVKEIEYSELTSIITDEYHLIRHLSLEMYNHIREKEVVQISSMVIQRIDDMFQTEAQSLGYDNIISACTYATSTGTFGPEGQSFVDWRDAVWTYVYGLEAKVKSGEIIAPGVNDIMEELPKRIVPA